MGHGSSQVFEMLPAFHVFRVCFFVRGVMHPFFSVGPSRQRGGIRVLLRRAGSSGISWRILSLLKKTRIDVALALIHTAHRRSKTAEAPAPLDLGRALTAGKHLTRDDKEQGLKLEEAITRRMVS